MLLVKGREKGRSRDATAAAGPLGPALALLTWLACIGLDWSWLKPCLGSRFLSWLRAGKPAGPNGSGPSPKPKVDGSAAMAELSSCGGSWTPGTPPLDPPHSCEGFLLELVGGSGSRVGSREEEGWTCNSIDRLPAALKDLGRLVGSGKSSSSPVSS